VLRWPLTAPRAALRAPILRSFARRPISSGASGREFKSPRSDHYLAQIKAPSREITRDKSQAIVRPISIHVARALAGMELRWPLALQHR
jgi:hypothetical protein